MRKATCIAVATASMVGWTGGVRAIPKAPHDEATNGVSCTDCHVPYGGLNGATQGAASSGSWTAITDSTSSWAADQWKDGVVTFVSGQNDGQYRQVVSNTATSVIWSAPLPAPIAAGDVYRLGKTTWYDIEQKCKTCHNPTGQAATMADVGLHPLGGGRWSRAASATSRTTSNPTPARDTTW